MGALVLIPRPWCSEPSWLLAMELAVLVQRLSLLLLAALPRSLLLRAGSLDLLMKGAESCWSCRHWDLNPGTRSLRSWD